MTLSYGTLYNKIRLSLKQIKMVANNLIPNFHLQRYLFWRYSLIWQKP